MTCVVVRLTFYCFKKCSTILLQLRFVPNFRPSMEGLKNHDFSLHCRNSLNSFIKIAGQWEKGMPNVVPRRSFKRAKVDVTCSIFSRSMNSALLTSGDGLLVSCRFRQEILVLCLLLFMHQSVYQRFARHRMPQPSHIHVCLFLCLFFSARLITQSVCRSACSQSDGLRIREEDREFFLSFVR